MDKTKAVNPSNKAKLAIAVQRYRSYMLKYGEDVDRNWGAQQLKDEVADLAIAFVLSEEG